MGGRESERKAGERVIPPVDCIFTTPPPFTLGSEHVGRLPGTEGAMTESPGVAGAGGQSWAHIFFPSNIKGIL